MDKFLFQHLFDQCFVEALQIKLNNIKLPSNEIIDAAWEKTRQRLKHSKNTTK